MYTLRWMYYVYPHMDVLCIPSGAGFLSGSWIWISSDLARIKSETVVRIAYVYVSPPPPALGEGRITQIYYYLLGKGFSSHVGCAGCGLPLNPAKQAGSRSQGWLTMRAYQEASNCCEYVWQCSTGRQHTGPPNHRPVCFCQG